MGAESATWKVSIRNWHEKQAKGKEKESKEEHSGEKDDLIL